MHRPDAEVIRTAAVAGRFYAGGRRELASTVAAHLAAGARCPQLGLRGQARPTGTVKALVCPHAGYIFSGPVAGSAYATLSDQAASIHRVVLIGPAHRVAVQGLVAASASAFETPMGRVMVDSVVGELCAEGLVSLNDEAHSQEHSLEVQLPFLQSLLPAGFTIVPLLFGMSEPAQVAAVIDRLWGDDVLIIISSDLSHFHPQSTATELDRQTSLAIEALDGLALGEGSACGRPAVQGLLEVAGRRGLVATAIDVRTSADTAGDPERVVGYGGLCLSSR